MKKSLKVFQVAIIALPVLFLLVSCDFKPKGHVGPSYSNSESKPCPHSEITFAVSVSDFLSEASGGCNDKAFLAAKDRVCSDVCSGAVVDDPMALFAAYYKEESHGGCLADVFGNGDFPSDATDDEIVALLSERYRMVISDVVNNICLRADKADIDIEYINDAPGGAKTICFEYDKRLPSSSVRKLVQRGCIQFWETYNLEEINNAILPAINEAYERAVRKDTAVAHLVNFIPHGDWMNVGFGSSVIGYSHVNDKDSMDKFLALDEVKKALPTDLYLMWGATAIDLEGTGRCDYVELYAIRDCNRDGKAPLEGDIIDKAEADFSYHGSEPCVCLNFNSTSMYTWANLTGKNIGRSIAIAIDNVVYSAPIVNEKISSGNCVISGCFTIEECKVLAACLSQSPLPFPTKIISQSDR